jgi:serine/threonine protein kinase
VSLSPGYKLAHYEIVELIGRGGMGEVYRAKDNKLGRDVAIKVLPDEFAQDGDRLKRFQREAKVLASLNHPGIAAIYGLERDDSTHYLVLELVPGETLGDRVSRGPIPVDEALDIAIKIAEALEEAHEQGIVHRDLKPANIKLTPDDKVKVLDFGLAKAFAEEAPDADSSMSPTITRDATRVGVILGTAAYMSPEQAKGKRVDKRTDIWAFGCVVYEMLTGKKAFSGDGISETLASVIKEEPELRHLPAKVGPRKRELVARCLKKDPRERLRDIGEARLALKVPGEQSFSTAQKLRGSLVWVALGSAVVAALLSWLLHVSLTSTPSRSPVRRATLALPEGQTQPRLLALPLALSPDGNLLAYVAEDDQGQRLFLRSLDSFDSRALPGTEGADMPFFSPDGEWVGFFAWGELKKASVERGTVLTIARATDGNGASWGHDGTIVYNPSQNAGLFRIAADGGTPQRLTTPDFGEAGYAHVFPQHLPGGTSILFNIWASHDTGPGGERAAVLDLGTGDWRAFGRRLGGASHLPTGHLLFYDNDLGPGLFATAFDAERGEIVGPSVQVFEDVAFYASQSARPFIAVAPNGTAVYVAAVVEPSTLAWMDRSGALTPILEVAGSVATPRLSPDEERVVFHDEQGSLKVLDLGRGNVDTVVARTSETGIWHPSGDWLAVGSNRERSWDIYRVVPTERREPEPVLVREFDQGPSSWSPDGSLLTLTEQHPETGFDLWVLPLGGDPRSTLVTPANEYRAMFSPTGSHLAYVSDESGRPEVYVRAYSGDETHLISSTGGDAPVWSKDGRELYFRNGRKFFAVEVSFEPAFRTSAPELLHEVSFDRAIPRFPHYYDVASDGRFLVVKDRSTKQFNVIFNWFEELNRLVPTED